MMKTKNITLIIACLFVAFEAGASPAPSRSYREVIADYITSHINSDSKKFKAATDEEMQLTIPRGNELIRQQRSELLSQLVTLKGARQQSCEHSYDILAESDALVIARVDFTYSFCKQQCFLIIEKNAEKEWKIKQVYKLIGEESVGESPVLNTKIDDEKM